MAKAPSLPVASRSAFASPAATPAMRQSQNWTGVDPADRLTVEIEGLLGFERGLPQFDGSFSAVRPVGATLAV